MRKLLLLLLLASSLYTQNAAAKTRKPEEDLSSCPVAAQSGKESGGVDILTNTQGVDFGPYLQRVITKIKKTWYNLISREARAPSTKSGKVSIEFTILKNGKVEGIRAVQCTGDPPMDRAAWNAVGNSAPFSPLPAEFKGESIRLRFRFLYNPQ